MQKILKLIRGDESSLNETMRFIDAMVLCKEGYFKYCQHDSNTSFVMKGIVKYLKENKNDRFYSLAKEKIVSNLVDTDLLINNADNPEILSLLKDFHHEILLYTERNIKTISDLPEKDKTEWKIRSLKNHQITQNLIKKVTPSKQPLSFSEFKDILPEEIGGERLNKLQDITNSKNNELLEIDLTIKMIQYNRKRLEEGQTDLDRLREDMNVFKELRNKFANRLVKSNALPSMIAFLHADLMQVYIKKGLKGLDTNDLWSDIERYSTDNLAVGLKGICNVELEGDGKFLYVYTQDGEFFLSPMKQKGSYVQHIMLANGKPVLMAGMVKLNNDGKIVEIDNSSGHYRPNIKNIKSMMSVLMAHNPDMMVKDHLIKEDNSGVKLSDLNKKMLVENIVSIRKKHNNRCKDGVTNHI